MKYKKKTVSIIEVISKDDVRGGYRFYGLGNDNKLYIWNFKKPEWILLDSETQNRIEISMREY